MTEYSIYKDIAERTGGDIYIGVVGPVRTGKSTFIKRFMESLVIPNIESEFDRERAKDEMPQSAAGRTVMTTEPKFIPDEAVGVTLGDNAHMRVRMIDCVGYIVPDSLGYIENGSPRMVMTPWSQSPMPFEQAAEFGTKKVIDDHSTIGILVTTDGSIGDIPRSSYADTERRVVNELKALKKPFAIILNAKDPENEETVKLAYELEESYSAPVALVNCLELNAEDIRHILELILLEFPVSEIGIELPEWTLALDSDHWLNTSLKNAVLECAGNIHKAGDVKNVFEELRSGETVKSAELKSIDLGTGSAAVTLNLADGLYYKIISELTGLEISGDEDLISTLRSLALVKHRYDKVAAALDDVAETGYGIVTPDIDDLRLEEPEIIERPGGYGVRLRASAPSIHMMRADIQTEINPVVGSEQQSEDLVKFLLNEFEEDPHSIWESNMFGKTLYELVTEGLHTKLSHMPEESRAKFSETLSRLINEGSGGMICIIL